MNDFSRIQEALKILSEYRGKGDVTAEHDTIWAGHGYKVSSEHKERLEQLGWFWDSDVGAFTFNV